MAMTTSDAVDVAIVATDEARPGEIIRAALTEKFGRKKKKYELFAQLTGYRIVPFVMSVYGLICKETRGLVAEWRKYAPDPSFIYDLYNNTQMAMITAQSEMCNYVVNKYRLRNERQKWDLAKCCQEKKKAEQSQATSQRTQDQGKESQRKRTSSEVRHG